MRLGIGGGGGLCPHRSGGGEGPQENTGTAVAAGPSAEPLFWVSWPHELTFPFGRVIGAVGSHLPGKRYGGASINPDP